MVAGRVPWSAAGVRHRAQVERVAWRGRLALVAFLFPLAALLCQLQYEKSVRPDSPPVLQMYLHADLGPVFSSRLLPRVGIHAIQDLGGGRLSDEHANALLQLVCIWGALVLTLAFARVYLAPVPALGATFLAALFPIWGLVNTAGDYTYPYDFPALLLSAAGLLAIAKRRTAWLIFLVLLGATNKETIVWLVPAFVLVWARSGVPHRRLLLEAAILAGLFAVVYELPRMLLDPAHGLSVTVQTHGSGTARSVQNLRELLFLNGRNLFTNVWYPFALHLPAWLFFGKLPGDLRRLYWATPFLLVPVFFFGNVSEARLFNEIIPLGVVAAMYVFVRHSETQGVETVPMLLEKLPAIERG